jgi:hypothetical protein
MWNWFKKKLPKKKSNMDKCYEYAVLALAYRRAAIKNNEKEDGFTIFCENTENYVSVN